MSDFIRTIQMEISKRQNTIQSKIRGKQTDKDEYLRGGLFELQDLNEWIANEGSKETKKALAINGVSNCATWKPTMCLRWYETDNYNAVNDDFGKILQQKWQSSEGEEKWEEIEVYER